MMNKQHFLLWLELSLLYIVIPIGLLAPIPAIYLTVFVLLALSYCLFLLFKANQLRIRALFAVPKLSRWSPILLRMFAFLIFSTAIVWLILPESLFTVVRENTRIWIGVCLFYSLVSVFPQELVYRYFFFSRYKPLLPVKYLLLLNAVLFCIAHTLFLNNLVFALTLVGGAVFAYNYTNNQSLPLVFIEHVFYGLWLYTLGLGDLLGFPTGLDQMSGPPGPLPLLQDLLRP